MAVWSESTLSEINKIKRNDAEYYQPHYKKLEKILNFSKTEQLSSLSFITDGIHGSPEIEKDGIRYISAKCVKDNCFITDNCIFISHKQDNSNPRTQLKNNDVIITTVGTIGNVAVVDEEIIPSNCDRHVGIIRIQNTDGLSPYYISTFLNSKYGRFQSMRESAGNVQLNLYVRNIGNIYIPRFFNDEEKIARLTKKAYEQRKQSQSLYTQAQQLLEQELGIDKLKFEKPVGYEASFSEVVNNNRADADYYQIQYQQIRKQILNYSNGWTNLIDCAESIKPNIDPKKTPNTHFKYIELSNINPSLGTIDGGEIILGKDAPSRARRNVKAGDIIASSVVGSVDKVALVDKNSHNCLASTGFFHLRSDKTSSEYLLILVRSKLVTMQFQQEATGVILSAVPDSRLKYVVVPKIQQITQDKISVLVSESHKAKRESQQLLNQAKTRVEQLIEEAAEKNG